MEDKKYLTSSQLARQLRVSVSTIKRHCHNGVLRFQKKSRNSYRLFVLKETKEDLYLINKLRAMGFSLRQIKTGRCVGIIHKSALEQALSRLSKRRRVIRERLNPAA